MSLSVLTAADGAEWESRLLAAVATGEVDFVVSRRCVDVVDLLAVAGAGHGAVALVDSRLRRLDFSTVERLHANGLVVIAVVPPGTDEAFTANGLGITHVVPSDAPPSVVESVMVAAVSDDSVEQDPAASRSFADPASATGSLLPPPVTMVASPDAAVRGRGSVIAVWGPTGAPGRTTLAVTLADELARLDLATLLVDADVYGGVVAPVLGLLDESPGLAAACRQAQAQRLDVASLAALAWQVTPEFRVLTDVPRPDRWPELRPQAVTTVLQTAREIADFTVVDVGFCLESDEELSFDTLAPRRNGATLAVLDEADVVVVVGSADPIGIQRLVRGLTELTDAGIRAPQWIVVNRVRKGPVPNDPAAEVRAALERFAGRSAAALLPYDRAALDAAAALGKTVGETAANSPFRRAVVELAASLAGLEVRARGRFLARR